MRRTMAACLLLFWGLTSVCAHAQEWVEVRSPHLAVFTDSTEQKARELADQFERMRAAFGVLFHRDKVAVPVTVQIIAFRNRYDFLGTAPLWDAKPRNVQGFFGAAADQDFLTVDLLSIEGWVPMLHESTHFFIRRNLPTVPLWFNEGMAVYCSGLRTEGKQIAFGTPSNWILRALKQSNWMPMSTLLRIGANSPAYHENGTAQLFYGQAWITIQYLMAHNQFDQLMTYIQLTGERNLPVDDAVRQAFGMEVSHLESAVRDYFLKGKITYYRAPAPPGSAATVTQVRKLDELEWQAVLADLHYWNPDLHDKARAEFRRILALRPANATANRTMGLEYIRQERFEEAAKLLARAAAAEPQDPRVHFFIAVLAYQRALVEGRNPGDVALMKRELKTAIVLDPDYAHAYNLLAYAEAADGNREGALAAMKKAIEINPQGEGYQEIQAEIARLAERKPDEVAERRRSTVEPTAPVAGAEANVKAEDNAPAPEAITHVGLPKPDARPIRFLKGKLVSIDCSAEPGAVLTVLSGGRNWTMVIPDTKKVLLIGSDTFSCSWRDRKVSVNYRLQSEGRGDLVSLELYY
jgi:tetratricopeptide (TPR) repeat protein